MNITIDTLRGSGELIDTSEQGTCQLWLLNGNEYVVLSDNTVITREEDLSDSPVFV